MSRGSNFFAFGEATPLAVYCAVGGVCLVVALLLFQTLLLGVGMWVSACLRNGTRDIGDSGRCWWTVGSKTGPDQNSGVTAKVGGRLRRKTACLVDDSDDI